MRLAWPSTSLCLDRLYVYGLWRHVGLLLAYHAVLLAAFSAPLCGFVCCNTPTHRPTALNMLLSVAAAGQRSPCHPEVTLRHSCPEGQQRAGLHAVCCTQDDCLWRPELPAPGLRDEGWIGR